MADEAKLHELLDIAEQALREGDAATAEKAKAAYLREVGEAPAAATETPVDPRAQAAAYMNENPVESGLDTVAALVSGMFATPAAGITGLVASPLVGADKAADLVARTQDALTYSPRTQHAREAIGTISKPFEWLADAGAAAGDAVQDSGFTLPGLDSAETATAARTIVEGVPQAILALLGGPKGSSAKPVRAAPTAEGRLLQSEGIQLKRSQMGSERAKSLDRGSDAVLGESAFDVKQAADYNRAVMKRAGGHVNGEGRVTPAELRDLKTDISSQYNALHARRSTPLDTVLEGELNQAIADAAADGLDASDPGARRVIAQVEQFRKLAAQNGGQVAGVAGQRIRTKLGELANGDDGFVANFARDVRDAMDSAWERAAPAADQALMKRQRARFRMALALQKAMKGNATGYISPNKLYSVIEDGHPFSDLAYAGKNVLPDSVANSGTPQRGADLGKLVAMGNPNRWGDLAKTLGAAFGGRLINESPNLGVRTGAVASNPGVAAAAGASSGQAMLAEQRRLTEEYLRAIGAL